MHSNCRTTGALVHSQPPVDHSVVARRTQSAHRRDSQANRIMIAQNFALRIGAFALALTLLLAIKVSCEGAQTTETTPEESKLKPFVDEEQQQLDSPESLMRAEPRQYFRIRADPAKLATKYRPTKQLKQSKRRSTDQQKQPELSVGKPTKQSISNATLKKLLNQSLLKGSNGTSASLGSKSNFKFVFIQRATAPPDAAKKSSSSSSSLSSTSKPIAAAHQASLAASVSRQLANSLLYSAANMVANLSSAPSLSSIASQIVLQSLDGPASQRHSSAKPATAGGDSAASSPPVQPQTSDDLSVLGEDIKRVQNSSKHLADTKSSLKSVSGGKKSTGKTKLPSRIYNLPVKFVANGQPSHLVFNTIRQHFATIKRLQATTSGAKNTNFASGKRRKLKGQNSRLIYLPLKYLSNARPNKLMMISKATHKSIA